MGQRAAIANVWEISLKGCVLSLIKSLRHDGLLRDVKFLRPAPLSSMGICPSNHWTTVHCPERNLCASPSGRSATFKLHRVKEPWPAASGQHEAREYSAQG